SVTINTLANGMNRFIGRAMGWVASITAIGFGITRATDNFAEFDDKIADAQKKTGLLREDVIDVNKELQKIDTRTSTMELLNLAVIAGKLGNDSKDDIIEFVKAADQIRVSLSEDLGGDIEDSIRSVGKLVDIFDLRQEFGLEKS